jgi:hypothetical protein
VELERPGVRVHVHLHETQAEVAIDLSGEALHRRGWRAGGGEAPLKENLAAAILMLASSASQSCWTRVRYWLAEPNNSAVARPARRASGANSAMKVMGFFLGGGLEADEGLPGPVVDGDQATGPGLGDRG